MIFISPLLKVDINRFIKGDIPYASHVVGLYRQFSVIVSSVHKDSQFDPLGTPEIYQGIHSGSDRPPCEKDIIYKDYCLIIYGEGQFRLTHCGRRSDPGQVVTIQGYIQHTGGEVQDVPFGISGPAAF